MEEKKSEIQLELEKILDDVNPGDFPATADNEYEDEARMFLSRINDSMKEDELLVVLHTVFQEMFNFNKDEETREELRPIIREYLKLKIKHLNH
ncbi:MAG: hypothetical protein A3I44_01695 [Candidatus Sungbacteria bacterium RIFCSPLOWO2_02_FULL_51_17]|nr:MAG: hypothetical protein A2676_04375 [Candidatus Sungbacteria bacterium RIFCSPHIGHO2_01_FULL_51_22]OHA11022.1 MAG: hypothetical protein A3I44_01695 [Candidatus Sungbacteria bacterium RIFCSPLOWO2_02_FULL_51_17]